MNATLKDVLELAFAPSTRETYKAGISKFKKFCDHHKRLALSADKETVLYFAAALSRSLSPATVKVYLSSTSAWHQLQGYTSPTKHSSILRLIMKGAKKRYAHVSHRRPTRQPLTTNVLMDVIRQLRAHICHLCKHDKRMLAAAFTLAFFGLLRVSEFTVPSKHSFDPHKHASLTSIRWGHNYFVFTIKSSKTDQFRHGQAVYIVKSDNDLCPFTAMHQYLKYCGTKREVPLFKFRSGHPLTRHSCLKHLRSILTAAGYQPLAFNTHSFRIGAATSAAQAGMSTSQIKLLGRWRSSAYQRYTRTLNKSLKSVASSLAKLTCNC